MKFVLFVEGHTEKKCLPQFLKRWLDARLAKPVGIKPVRYGGWSDYVRDLRTDVRLMLDAPDIIAGVGLLDLYGPTFYPPDKATVADRFAWGKAHLEGLAGHAKFVQHFAVHETEAWLLAAPANLPRDVAAGLPGKAAKPETVNFDEPPSKLLHRLYREKLKRKYEKVNDGGKLFQLLSPEVAAEKCPTYFKPMLDDLLQRAKAAGA